MPAIVIPAPINSNHVAPVAAGGTGATTAANARTNLDVYSKSDVTSAIAQSTAKSSSPNLPSDTYSAGTTKTVLVGSGWSGRSLLSVVAIGEYPTGFMQDVSVVAGWINGDNLYVAVNNHSNASKTGVLQIRAYYL